MSTTTRTTRDSNMSNQLSSLDFSELPDPYLRPTVSSAGLPPAASRTAPPPHLPTSSAVSPSTSAALDYQAFNPLTPTTIEAWMAASQTNPTLQPAPPSLQPTQSPPPPAHIFSSFLQPQLDQNLISPAVSNPSLKPNNSLSFRQPRSDRMLYTAPIRTAARPKSQPLTTVQTDSQPQSVIPSSAVPPSVVPPSVVPPSVVPPSLAAPAITAPAITAPAITAPAITAPAITAPAITAPALTAPAVTARSLPVSSDGLTAVERAKRVADHFTMSQLAKKRKAAGLDPDPKRPKNLSSSKSSTDEDEKNTGDLPERISHRKYQKRLQKNRDSAFVSRIRRREYTRLLEESLTNTEKEKDAAINSFLDMKRRFDIVSAELNAFRQAFAPNLTAFKDSFFSQLSTSSADTKPPRPGSAITSMFMFTLLFGILLPDFVRHRVGVQRSSAYTPPMRATISSSASNHQSAIRSMFFGNMLRQNSHQLNSSRGKVWGQSTTKIHVDSNTDSNHKHRRQEALKTIRKASFELLGVEHSEQFTTLTQSYLEGLCSAKISRLREVFGQGNATRFEQLVEVESLMREVEPLRPKDCQPVLDHVALQLENAKL